MRKVALLAAALAAVVPTLAPLSAHAETAATVPPPTVQSAATSHHEIAVLAGGCFWGIQAVYQHIKGVKNAVSGYAGGNPGAATYNAVSTGTTGHAESVQVTFDPHVVSYGQILQVFFAVAHDPTELNRQGPDIGTQYRSEIFPQTEAQAKFARDYIAQLDAAKVFAKPIVTQVGAPKTAFFRAEDYHQDYATLHPMQPYIMFNDAPKVAKLQALFPDLWRDPPVTVAKAGSGTN
jgi:peptide-methionine (S)-S-oxide reductase